jgi:hypothetical protein
METSNKNGLKTFSIQFSESKKTKGYYICQLIGRLAISTWENFGNIPGRTHPPQYLGIT